LGPLSGFSGGPALLVAGQAKRPSSAQALEGKWADLDADWLGKQAFARGEPLAFRRGEVRVDRAMTGSGENLWDGGGGQTK